MMPNNNSDDLQDKLIAARLAMSPDREKEEWHNREEYLIKRKQEAALEMASSDQKAKFEDAARTAVEKEAAQKKLEELRQQRRIEEEKRKQEVGQQQNLTDEKAEAERRKKIDEILESKAEISGMVTQKNALLRPIRTYTGDMAETVREDQISASKIIIQEKAKRLAETQAAKQNSSRRDILFATAGTLFIVGGLAIGTFALWQKIKTDQAPVAPKKTSIIFADRHEPISITGKDTSQINNDLRSRLQAAQASGTALTKESIDDVYFTKTIKVLVDDQLVDKTVNLTADEYLASTSPGIGDDLARFVDSEYMIGIYHGFAVSPFFIFKTTQYKNLADLMLANGQNVLASLYSQFWDSGTIENIQAGQFKDVTIKNYDLRVLKGANDTTLALYSFLDNGTLLIAPNEEFFQKLLSVYLVSGQNTR